MKQILLILGLAVALSSCAKDWYETAAFYQIYPQTFFDGGGGYNGTGSLKGIEAKLDYIKDLGIDCLWLTPIFKSTFNAYGYDITDYMDIDPRYGTKEDFSQLIKAVHNKEMKIIVDFVPNHCGKAHEFFEKSESKDGQYDDWFVWTDKIGWRDEADGEEAVEKPSNWQRIGDGPGTGWTKSEKRKEFYYGQFGPNMPDLNLRNPEVNNYLKDVMEFWLDMGIDGFRIDAISHGIEVEPDETTKVYPNEAVREPKIDDKKDFDYLIHNLTQDQPELFEIIYDWRKFLDEYQTAKKSDVK